MASGEKKYGLQEPKKKMTVADVFNNDSDSGDERGSKDWIKKKLQKEAGKEMKMQTIIDMNRALEQDPTVYQYDEVYDTLKKNESEVNKPKAEKKVKYMDALLKTADRRRKENERRTERLVQKEREAEGEEFKDKEEFITSSYRQKLEEIKKAEEEEKKMEYIESVMDVTKQQDMGSFYRQLYKETIPGDEPPPIKEERKSPGKEIKENAKKTEVDEKKSKKEMNKKESSSSGSSESDSSSDSSSSSSDSSSDDENKKDIAKESKVSSEDSKTKASIPSTPATLEDGEIASAAEEDKKLLEKPKEPAVVVPDSVAKFSASSRRDRTYRQRESSIKDGESSQDALKERNVLSSGSRKEERSYSHRDDRGRERDRAREREADRSRRNDRRPRARSNDRSRDNRSERDRRERSRSRNRRDHGSSRSSPKNLDKKEKKRPRDISPPREEDKKQKGRSGEKEEKKSNDEPRIKEADSKRVEDKSKPSPTLKNGNLDPTIVCDVKVDIWKKRTVGAVFDAALQRYFERKAARGS